jgi:hypothetical protein
VATIPGAAIVAAHYGEDVVVYSAEERIEISGAYGAPPGPEGFNWTIEPGKPVRIPYEAARLAREIYGESGLVEVDVREDKDKAGSVIGTRYDLDKARKESIEKLRVGDEARFKRWLSGVIEDYVKRSKPVPPPDEAISRVIARRRYDLKKYGIVPIGWGEAARDTELESLKAQLAELQAKLKEKKYGFPIALSCLWCGHWVSRR